MCSWEEIGHNHSTTTTTNNNNRALGFMSFARYQNPNWNKLFGLLFVMKVLTWFCNSPLLHYSIITHIKSLWL